MAGGASVARWVAADGAKGRPVDFDDTPEEAAFRREVRAFLDAHADRRAVDPAQLLQVDTGPGADAQHVHRCRAWQGVLFEHGWAGITWPKEYGGRGGTAVQQAIFDQEQAAFDVSTGVFAVGIGMAGPTVIAHGTEDQKRRYLEPMLRGTEIWCQLFSEPGSGSDLASLATRAERDGDTYVVNGQKVWNTGAHYSDMAILLARTDPDVEKHAGISFFLVDMSTPGIDVRPLRQINGAAHFNEVFLTDVRIPADNVLGALNGGWQVARTTLANERTLIGGLSAGRAGGLQDVLAMARRRGAASDPVVRQDLARMVVRTEILRFLGLRVRTAASRGQLPGPESSVMKLAVSQHVAATGDLVMSLDGAAGMLFGDDAPDHGFWQHQFLTQWSTRIGGGTDQIQRNVIAERALGLPRDIPADRGVPWRKVAGGGSVVGSAP